jgi:hypothetical protein
MPEPGAVPARQRGWAAVITLLLAVLIVALLAATLLKQYGAPGAFPARAAPDPGDAGAKGPASGAAPVGTDGAVPAPTNAIERARALEESVKQMAADHEKRIDDAVR